MIALAMTSQGPAKCASLLGFDFYLLMILDNLSPTLGPKTSVTMRKAAAFTIKPLRQAPGIFHSRIIQHIIYLEVESQSPGPAAYSTFNSMRLKRSSPAYSLGSRVVRPGENTEGKATNISLQLSLTS